MLTAVLTAGELGFSDHLERLRSHIRQPSISTQPLQISSILARLSREVHALGGSANVFETKSLPILIGRFLGDAGRTIVIHCMYDTVPADEKDWICPAFSASRIDVDGIGECIVGRGAEDTKGPYTAVLNAIASYRAAQVNLPANILLLMEGSELGSAGIAQFMAEHPNELGQADVVYFPWHTERADHTAVVWLGAKGLITLKLSVRGGDWGGPLRFDLHGSHANWVASPVDRLVCAIASMKQLDGAVSVAGFYDGLRTPSPSERRLVQQLFTRADYARLLGELGVSRLKQQSFAAAIEAYCFGVEFNISGIKAGAVLDDGFKTQVPREATASLDIRPLPGMSCDRIIESIRTHLKARGFPEVIVEISGAYPGGGTSADNWAIRELLGTYEDCGYDPEIWPRTARSIAAGLYTEALGLPWIATMPGHAGRQHAANEFVSVEGYRKAIEFVSRLLWRLGSSTRAS